MTASYDVAIDGDGPVGCTLALALAAQGLRVALRGLAPAAANQDTQDLRAYALNPASCHTLQQLQAWPEPAHCQPLYGLRVYAGAQEALQFNDAPTQPLGWLVRATDLHASLHRALAAQPLVQQLKANPSGAPQAALHVHAEGKHGTSSLGPPEVLPYPHHALALQVRVAQPHRGLAYQWFDDDCILALLPLSADGEADQANRMAVVWSMPAAQAASWQHASAETLAQHLAHQSHGALGTVEVTSAVARWPLQLTRHRHWVAPGRARVGDAAHTVHPLAGQGLNLGLADAAALAACVATRGKGEAPGSMRVLRRYSRQRRLDTALMQTTTEALFFGLTPPRPLPQALRHVGLSAFNAMAPLKRWATRHAMGLAAG